MADLAWFSALFIVLCSLPGFWDNLHSSQERKKHIGTFFVHVRRMVLELAFVEKKKKKEEEEEKKVLRIYSSDIIHSRFKDCERSCDLQNYYIMIIIVHSKIKE